jgi:hypothetical protein
VADFNPIFVYSPEGVRIATAAMREANPVWEPELEPAEPVLTPEAQRLLNIAEVIATGDFGCRRADVHSLVTAIVGPLPNYVKRAPVAKPSRPPLIFKVGAVLAHDNGNCYLINHVDGDGDAFFYNADGTSGSLSNEVSGTWIAKRDEKVRPATEEEVERFLIEAELIPAPAVRLEAAAPPPGSSIPEGE